jgi:hypothetical protein
MTLSILVLDKLCCYAECYDYSNVILSVIMLSALMINVVAPSLCVH